ncbi:MAG: S49 family peptidase, partial [Planctomycetes bacterium]|nr:S49 family peptidase [Planctomycetota bacterium]
TEQEREVFLATMRDVYRLFTSKVASGRKLDMETIGKLAEGRVFTGRMAKDLGLVDRLGTLDDAIDEAKKLAGIGADEAIERVLLPEPRGLFDDLFSMAGDAAPVARVAGARTTSGSSLARESLMRAVLLARMAGPRRAGCRGGCARADRVGPAADDAADAGACAVAGHAEDKGGLTTERSGLQSFFFRGDFFRGD